MPSVLVVAHCVLSTCDTHFNAMRLFFFSPKNQNKGGGFVHHSHVWHQIDIGGWGGVCICGPLRGHRANDKTRQIKCLLRRTSSAWQDDGGGLMGKKRRKNRREAAPLQTNTPFYACWLERAAGNATGDVMESWLAAACRGKITPARHTCVRVTRVCVCLRVVCLQGLERGPRWRCRPTQAGSDKTERGIWVRHTLGVEQMGSGKVNSIAMSVLVGLVSLAAPGRSW